LDDDDDAVGGSAAAVAFAAIGEFVPSATAARPNSANLRCSRSEKLVELLVGRVVVVVVPTPKGGAGIVDRGRGGRGGAGDWNCVGRGCCCCGS
jgi:hypothetical protein